MTNTETKKPVANLAGTVFLQTATLQMLIPGTADLSGWILTLAGPSHPQSVELFEKQARRANKRAGDIERAQVNSKKWKGDEDRDPEDIRRETVSNVVARILDWTPVNFGEGAIEFSQEAAIELFLDRGKGAYFGQLVEYLTSEKAFMTASAKG